jgi:hypothetical protein
VFLWNSVNKSWSLVALAGVVFESLRGESSARQSRDGDQIRWLSGMFVIRSRVYGVWMAPFLFGIRA